MSGDRVGPVVSIEHLTHAWGRGPCVLDMPGFHVEPGESVFLRGPSGSGKSTLLGLIAGVLTPQAGRISVLGHDMGALRPTARDRLRADQIGVIFQLFNLLSCLSAAGTVIFHLPLSDALPKA